MRVQKSIASLTIAAAILSGCGAPTAGQYEALKESLRDPTARQAAVADCRRDVDNDSAADRANMAAFLGVPVSRAGSAFCNRLFDGIASGRVSHADLFQAQRSGDYSKLIAILRGR
jgi:hypothetical protein